MPPRFLEELASRLTEVGTASVCPDGLPLGQLEGEFPVDDREYSEKAQHTAELILTYLVHAGHDWRKVKGIVTDIEVARLLRLLASRIREKSKITTPEMDEIYPAGDQPLN